MVPIAGIEDVTRSYVRDGRPIVTGVVAVGDAAVATNPSLGRGASLGALQAVVLRDVLAGTPTDIAGAFAAAWTDRVQPWIDATTWFDRHRLAEMGAEARGERYCPDDIGWAMSAALRRGAAADPVLARASARIGGLLALPLGRSTVLRSGDGWSPGWPSGARRDRVAPTSSPPPHRRRT